MKFQSLLILGFFLTINTINAQVDHIFGVRWIDNFTVLSTLTNIDSDLQSDLDTLSGVYGLHSTNAALDSDGGRYFIVSNRGITITDIYTGLITDTIAYPYFLNGMRYHKNTNSLYALRNGDDANILVKIDLLTNTYTDVDTVEEFSFLYNPSFTIDQGNGIYYTTTELGITGIDLLTGDVVDSMSAPTSLRSLEYHAGSNSLYGMRWTGSDFLFSRYDLDLDSFNDFDSIGGCAFTDGNTAIDTINGRYFISGCGGILSIDIATGVVLDTLAMYLNTFGIEYIDSYIYLSMEEQSVVQSYNLYPNPSTGAIHIVLDKTYSDIELEVIDLQGKIISKYDFFEQQKLILDLHYLVNGSYIIQVRTDNKLGLVKFMKK